ncbi:MAG: membrane protein [Pseudohongiella sp.]|nr:MAG: membrane protein [Pseudohongiella sp.]
MFESLEMSAVAQWVGLSLWAYPLLLSAHIVGLAIVVGIFSMRDLRLLGLFPGLRADSFLTLGKLGWVGFIINAVSGILLFTSQAVTFISSTPFLIKISCIVAGMVMAGIIQARLRGELASGDGDMQLRKSTKLIALASLTLWVAAIIAGRLIAYL